MARRQGRGEGRTGARRLERPGRDAAGLPLPTDRVAPQAAAALALAERRMEAAGTEARASTVTLAHVVQAARDEWLPVAEGVVEDTQSEAIEALGTLAELCDRLVAKRGVAAALKRWPSQGCLVGVSFLASEDQVRAEGLRQSAEYEIRNRDRQGFASHCEVRRDMAHLLAAVSIEISGRESPVRVTLPRLHVPLARGRLQQVARLRPSRRRPSVRG